MEYEWDERKRRINMRKHGVDFVEAVRFEWDSVRTEIDEGIDHDEYRFRSLGMIGRFLHVLIWTDGQEAECRIISLRKASKKEVRDYVRWLEGR